MRRLIVWEFLTLDGVMEAPGFEEHRKGRQGWAIRLADDGLAAFQRDLAFGASAFLLGRRTYQIWAAFWPTYDLAPDFAEKMNQTPKYVYSNTMREATWARPALRPSKRQLAMSLSRI